MLSVSYSEAILVLVTVVLYVFAGRHFWVKEIRPRIQKSKRQRRKMFHEVFGFWPEEGKSCINQGIVDRVLTFMAEEYLIAKMREELVYGPYKSDSQWRHFPVAPWVDRMVARNYRELRRLAFEKFDQAGVLARYFGFDVKSLSGDYLRHDSPIRRQVEDILDASERPTQPMPQPGAGRL